MTTRTVPANGISLAYESFGDDSGEPVVLVMGLGTQMLAWHEDFCHALVERGCYVVRFDNRDVGLSTHLVDAPVPDVMAALGGDLSSASYDLETMADDTAGLLDALGLQSAHLVGASMGGMIAQAFAVRHPTRTRTLTSIMSTPGPRIGAPTQAALAVLLAPPVAGRDASADRAVTAYRVIGSPGYPLDEQWLRGIALEAYDRAYDPLGVARQLVAIQASGDRTASLAGISAPTLVVHGDADQLVQVEGGRATAAAIPGAELMIVPGMGHSLPREIWPQLVDAIARLATLSRD